MNLSSGREYLKAISLAVYDAQTIFANSHINEYGKKPIADMVEAVGRKNAVKKITSNLEEIKDITEYGRNLNDLPKFILDRLKVYLKDKGIRHDIIDAAFVSKDGNGGGDDLVAIVNRTNALQDFLGTSEGENLLAGYKRAANILKAEGKKAKANKESLPTGAPSKPKQAEAVALYDALQTAAPAIETALEGENYAEAMQNLAKLRSPIDAFFDHVTVVSDDSVVRENNLRLLAMIRDTARQIADFEAIQG